MRVAYRHFLIPANGELVPSPARVSGLLQRLVDYRFLPTTAPQVESMELLEVDDIADESLFVRLAKSDYRLSWSLRWPSHLPELRYPFLSAPREAALTLSVHGSVAYLAPLSELVDPLGEPSGATSDGEKSEGLLSRVKGLLMGRDEPLLDLAIRCGCGASLEDTSELFVDCSVLLPRCPACGLPFRPSDRKGKLRSGWSNGLQRRDGGMYHRFGVVLDGGADSLQTEGPAVLDPKFLKVVSDAIGASLFEFPDLS